MSDSSKTRKIPVDYKIFWPSILAVLLISLPLAVNPDAGLKAVKSILKFYTGQFGWLFLWYTIFCFFALLWLACSRYGRIKLGRAGDQPEFSYYSYIAMMFCAGYGVGIMIWGFIEGSYFLNSPPFYWVEARSSLAVEWAQAYAVFHRGFSIWAVYCLPAIPIAYSLYVRKNADIRLSAAAKGILGSRADGWAGKTIDIFVVFGILGGVGTSLGLAVPMVSGMFSELFGLPDNFGTKLLVICLWTLIFGGSVYKGLSKGIKFLSDINIYLAMGLVGFILLSGPTVFILKSCTNAFGMYLDSFFRMSFWMDPVNNSGFPENWTVFYWAWWLAVAPMMGLFVARISKGRTIREVITAHCLFGTIGAGSAFLICGSYVLHLNITGVLDTAQLLKQSGQVATIIAILKTLPVPGIVMTVYTILIFIFLSTTIDSSSYTLATVCSLDIGGEAEPARWHRVLWAVIIAGVALILVVVGGLKAVQLSSVVVAGPLVPIMIVLFCSLMKWIKQDFGDKLASAPLTIDDK